MARVASTHHEIPIVAPRPSNLKLEAVSARLKGEFIHPNESGRLIDLAFSPDGKRLIASNYPGGVAALWNVADGKRLTTIEMGRHTRFFLAPDWQILYSPRENHKSERIEQDGKRMIRWTFDGDIRAWSLNDGKLIRTYKHEPPRGMRWMKFSPDGTKFLTDDSFSGTSEGVGKVAASLWDVKTGAYRTFEGLRGYGVFSPDGKIVALSAQDPKCHCHALKLIDVATGREKCSIPIADKNATAFADLFSRDGRLLFGTVRVSEHSKQGNKLRCQLKWWDTAVGREVASFDCEPNDNASFAALSPNGHTLVALNWEGEKRKLSLFNVREKRLEWTIRVAEKSEERQPNVSSPIFSPDGKWIAVVAQMMPEKWHGEDLDPRDMPQSHILLIETAAGEIRETIVSPPSFAGSACFSPDGRTLATDGHGRVLLWDMTKMPALTSR